MKAIKKHWGLGLWTTALILLVGAIVIFQIQCNGGGGGGGGNDNGGGCTNACTTSGAKECSGSGYHTCVNYNKDSCLEWSAVTDCGAGETCSNGICGCSDICSPSGTHQCQGTTGYETCGNYNADDCLEWSSVTNCGATEACSNGNCISTCVDNDGDGYYPLAGCGTDIDCDDSDPLTYPGAPELCPDVDGGGINNDCDPLNNLICDCTGPGCVDNDGDEYASTGSGGTDCNDNNASINPNAVEVCPPSGKNIDENCDGSFICDGGLVDADGDNYGAKPQGTDCDDNDPNTYPNAPELCDGKDNNCNGTITDEGSPEKCNGIDDDCDTLIDELWPSKGSTCGNCGIYVCNATQDGLACSGEGVCSVGLTQNQNCGNCNLGTETRTCNASCQWGAWGSCTGGGVCSPGQIENQGCGQCSGRQSRTCNSSCVYGSWGSCTCNSQTGYQSCGDCGQQSRTCNTSSVCNWSSWGSCACSTSTTSQTCPTDNCGGHGTQTRTCSLSNSCFYGSWGSCTGDYDNTPPSIPASTGCPKSYFDTDSSTNLITFSSSSDNCGLAWTADGYPGAYQLQIDDNSSFSSPNYDARSDIFEEFPSDFPHGVWYWRIRAWDKSGNTSNWSTSCTLYIKHVIFTEGFEGPFPPANWYVGDDNSTNGSDYWGDSGTRSYEGSYSAWCAQYGTQGDNDCGAFLGQQNYNVLYNGHHIYDNYMESWLDRRNINLVGYTSVTVDFYYWLVSENNADFLIFSYRDSSGAWSSPWSRTGSYSYWNLATVNLNSLAGQSNVYIQFKFRSDVSVHCYEGAYVDKIVLYGY